MSNKHGFNRGRSIMDRLTESCGPNHFRVCGNKTVYNRKPPKSSRVSYALAKLFQLEEDQEPQSVRWIPVEEQLPEIGEPVLITLWNGCVDIGTWYGHRWGTALYYSEDVLAWMPKPENCRPAD